MERRIPRRFEPLSDFELEAYVCGELSGAALERVERELATNAELRQYLELRQRTREEFVAKHPLQLPAADSGVPPRPKTNSRRGVVAAWALGSALAAAGVLAVVVPHPSRDSEVSIARDTVRVKGEVFRADLYVKRGEQVWKHRPELGLRPGDQLRLQVESSHASYLTLLGRDAHRQIHTYYAGLRTQAGVYTVPDSLMLDSQEGDEQWLLVLSEQPLSADSLVQRFERDELTDLDHVLFTIRKDPP